MHCNKRKKHKWWWANEKFNFKLNKLADAAAAPPADAPSAEAAAPAEAVPEGEKPADAPPGWI